MSADDGTLVVQIELDDGSVRQGFVRVQKAGEDAAGGVQKAFEMVAIELIAITAAIATAVGFKEFFGEAIDAASKADTTLQKMNLALAVTGRYSQETSEQFQELADKIGATTTTSAQTALGLETLALTYTKTGEQATKLTKASIDLAAATGVDVNTAMQQLSATLAGHIGRLGQHYTALQQFSAGQLRAGAAIDYFNSRFGGAAASQMQTYGAQMMLLHNNVEEFFISLGRIVTTSPTVIAAIGFISDKVNALTGYFKGFAGQDLLKAPTLAVIEFGRALIMYIGAPLEVVANTAIFVFDTLKTGFAAIILTIVGMATDLVTTFAPNSALAQSLKSFTEISKNQLVALAKDTHDAFFKISTDFSVTAGADKMLEDFQRVVQAAKAPANALTDLNAKAHTAGLGLYTVGQSFKDIAAGFMEQANQMALSASKSFNQIGATAMTSLGQGVASGMAAIGKALVKGEDIFKAFAGAMLGALGQAAVQMGAMYIMIGTARLIASYGADAAAWDLIGVGAGMSILGGALMALGSGVSGGGAASPGTSGAASGGTTGALTPQSSTPAQSVQPTSQQAAIQVNIHGDVLDSQETGMRIVDLINGAYNNNGAKIVGQV
jgi:hypothetical protein